MVKNGWYSPSLAAKKKKQGWYGFFENSILFVINHFAPLMNYEKWQMTENYKWQMKKMTNDKKWQDFLKTVKDKWRQRKTNLKTEGKIMGPSFAAIAQLVLVSYELFMWLIVTTSLAQLKNGFERSYDSYGVNFNLAVG